MLAQMYRLGRGNTPPDQAKATQIFKNTCDAGDHFVCVTYAQRLKDGTGAPKPDLAAAETVLDAACKEDEETACLRLSQWVHDAKTDDARAFRLASRACTLNSARGCFLAAYMVRYDRRGPGGLTDPAKKSTEALALAESGCTLGSGNACTEAGELLEEAKDLARALEKFTAGCAATEDQNGNSCIYLTRYLILGTAGAKDKKGGHKAAIRACTFIPERCAWVPGTAEDADDIKLAQLELGPLCDQDQFAACVALGQTLAKGTFEDKRHGREVFGAACRKKHMPACMLEADAIYNGIGGDADKPAGEKLFRRYCDDKDRESCFQVAFYHRQDTDADGGKITLEYADRACTLDHAEGCNLAGFVNYTAMKPVRWDITAAVKYYAKACELGSSSACGNMGEVYRYGLGASIDQVKALAHYQKSCDSGSQYGCGGLAHYLATGDGGAKKDLAKAEELFKGACEADTIEACVELATLLEKAHGSPGEIARLRLRALQLAEDQGKTNPEYKYFLGTFHRDGMATMKDPAKALVLFGEACDSFDPFGCIAAGKLLVAKGTPPDRERARVYFQRACAAGVDDGCQGIKDAELGPSPSPAVVQAKGCGCHSEVAPGGLAGGAALLGSVVLALRRRRRR
ncbi:MAG: MYXO-CTERM sorting domain-containing protein [Proteobacteria bacterium]|nr:MYXO-CTERM sorting domain-containing protein [Pseudomonadota bacterium]